MGRSEKTAFDATKDIVVTTMTNLKITVDKDSGIVVGEYFQEIYKRILEVSKDIKE